MKVPAAIARALDSKIAHIRAQLAEAEDLRKEAEALKAEYQAKAKAAESEAKAMIERAHVEAGNIVAKAKTDAEALIERRGRMAEDKIAAEEQANRVDGHFARRDRAKERGAPRPVHGSKVRIMNDRLSEAATLDPLTGLLNRRGIEDVLGERSATRVAMARRSPRS